jgi:hypothetical protein
VGIGYQYPNYQVEYSRNLNFEIGGHMDQFFQALIDRSRVPLDLTTIKTILGYRRRPRYHQRKKKSAQWEVAVEKPTNDLTILKLHCCKLTLKIYTKGERALASRSSFTIPRSSNVGVLWRSFPRHGANQAHSGTVCRCLELH